MLGKKLTDLNLRQPSIPYFGVKEAVFPFNMFPEVDPVLGPEMRSTGEVLGLADSFGLAFFKSQQAAKQKLPSEGSVLMTVTDSEKQPVVKIAREFEKLGFKIKATEGTYKFLAGNGIKAEHILKMHEGRPNIVDAIKNGEIQLIINTPAGRKALYDDSYIRKAAIKYKIPYITTTAAAAAAVVGIAESVAQDARKTEDREQKTEDRRQKTDLLTSDVRPLTSVSVRSLQSYHAALKLSRQHR
jgi:carbamoyl-phosphate synthase large subunit